MKKLLAIILTLASVACIFCGCGNEKQKDSDKSDKKSSQEEFDDSLLPYGLEFGMPYNDATKTCEDFPSINPANSNDGYASEKFSPDYSDYEKFFSIDGVKLYEDIFNGDGIIYDPGYYFSFNESKKLYEFCVMTRICESENSAEVLFNEYLDYYNKKIKIEAEVEEYSDGLEANWQTDTLSIYVVMEISDDDEYLVYTTIHNKKYELKD